MQAIATWQALIAALLGAALAFAGVWWNSRSNLAQLKLRLDHEDKQLRLRLESEERLHRQRLSKEKLEELYGLIHSWSIALLLCCGSLSKLMRKEITVEQHRQNLSSPSVPNYDLGRLEMIAGIYGGELQTIFNEVMNIKDKIAMVEMAFSDALNKKESFDNLITPLNQFQREFAVTVEAFKKEIIKAAKAAKCG
jgi:hypothetical protein